MKKNIFLFGFIAIMLASCGKDDEQQAVHDANPSAPQLTPSALQVTQVQPGPDLPVGGLELKIGSMDGFKITFKFQLASTASFAQVRNFTYKVLTTDSTVKYMAPVKPTGATITGIELQGFLPNTTYIVVPIVSATSGTVADVTVSVGADYSWVDRNGVVQTGTISPVTGQTVSIKPYSSPLDFEWNEFTGALQDSVNTTLYDCYVDNNGTDPVSLPQLTYSLNVLDVSGNDNLKVINPWITIDGVTMAGQIEFVKATGQVTTYFGEGAFNFFVPFINGSRDHKLAPGRHRIVFGGMPTGFHHTGNQIATQLLIHDDYYSDHGFLNFVAPTLHNLTITPTVNAVTGGTSPNFISAIVGPVFSAIPGGSTGLFTNGYVYDQNKLPVQYRHQN